MPLRVRHANSLGRGRRGALAAAAIGCLGVATTVAVAWGLALSGMRPSARVGEITAWPVNGNDVVVFYRPRRGMGAAAYRIELETASAITDDQVVISFRDADGWSASRYTRVSGPPDGLHVPPPTITTRREYHFGWPFPAFWSAFDLRQRGDVIQDSGNVETLIIRPGSAAAWGSPFNEESKLPRGARPLAVPTGVLSRGFALDTITYGAAWGGLVLGFGATRRARRRGKGQCVRCCYDLRGIAAGVACPDCGHAGRITGGLDGGAPSSH